MEVQDEPPDNWMCAYCCVDCVGGKKGRKERSKATQACREMEQMKRENEDEGSSKGGVPCAAPLDDHFFLNMNENNNNDHEDDEDHEDHEDDVDHEDNNNDHEDDVDHEVDEVDEDDEDDNDDDEDEDDEDVEDDEDDEDDEDNDDDDEDDDDVGTFSNEVEGGVPGAPHSKLIKRLHLLNQKPNYRRSDTEKDEIDLIMKQFLQMKSMGEIGGKPCGLDTAWTYEKEAIGKHKIGRMVGQQNGFKVYPDIICTGDNPSLGEVITAIKQTKDTKIGKEVSIIEVPVDALEYCGYEPFAQNAKAFITSRFELIYGLKNKNGELEVYHFGNKKGEGRKNVSIRRRMFVDRPLDENKAQQKGRFGLMCFTANRDKSDWDRCECDHINGDPTDDREENVRLLTPADNKRSYYDKRAQRSNAARA